MIRDEVFVRVDPERARTLFTQHLDAWWPRGHRLDDGTLSWRGDEVWDRSGARERLVARMVENTSDALVLDWFMASPAPSRVEIRFVPRDGGTRVVVEHRAGALDAEAFAKIPFARGWAALLSALRAATESHEEKT